MTDIHASSEALKPSDRKVEHVGGQAVIEGVMMRAPKAIVIAVRKPDESIVIKREKLTPLKEKFRPFGWPILRGIAVLVESLIWGMKALTYSANQAVELEGEEEESGEPPKEMGRFAITVTMLVSFAVGIGLFVILPERLANLVSERGFIFNIADCFIRLIVFLVYILAISRIKYIARVFEYHGAEHKSIHAYEAGEELTEENALKYSPQHPRCGTAFLMTVMVVGILVFSMFGKPAIITRIGIRLLLMPFIAGVSYEIIKLTSKKRHNRFVKLIMLPGLWMQRLTTREPSKDQIQVALRSLREVLAMDAEGAN